MMYQYAVFKQIICQLPGVNIRTARKILVADRTELMGKKK